jgi:hypothetical protein
MNALVAHGLMAQQALASRPDLDAKLIATCAKFDVLERRYIDLITAANDEAEPRGEDGDHTEADKVLAQGRSFGAYREDAAGHSPGRRALAATIVLENPDRLGQPCDRSAALIKTLLRGLPGEYRS